MLKETARTVLVLAQDGGHSSAALGTVMIYTALICRPVLIQVGTGRQVLAFSCLIYVEALLECGHSGNKLVISGAGVMCLTGVPSPPAAERAAGLGPSSRVLSPAQLQV